MSTPIHVEQIIRSFQRIENPRQTPALAPVAPPKMYTFATLEIESARFGWELVPGNDVFGYLIYRHISDAPNAATRIAFVAQPPGQFYTVPIFYSESIPAGTTYYYWITTVNARGGESAKVPAQKAAVTSDSVKILASGTYTPTLTKVANLDGTPTAFECQYLRVGDTVTVSGRVTIDPTAAATSTKLGISLPVPSNFGAVEDCCGTAFCPTIANQGAAILADAVNDRMQMEWISADITAQDMYFHATYQVI